MEEGKYAKGCVKIFTELGKRASLYRSLRNACLWHVSPPPLQQFMSVSLRVRAFGKKILRIQHCLPEVKVNIWVVNPQQLKFG